MLETLKGVLTNLAQEAITTAAYWAWSTMWQRLTEAWKTRKKQRLDRQDNTET